MQKQIDKIEKVDKLPKMKSNIYFETDKEKIKQERKEFEKQMNEDRSKRKEIYFNELKQEGKPEIFHAKSTKGKIN